MLTEAARRLAVDVLRIGQEACQARRQGLEQKATVALRHVGPLRLAAKATASRVGHAATAIENGLEASGL